MNRSDPNARGERLDAALDLLAVAGGRHVVPVTGESMLPTLAPGDALQVEFGGGRPRPGDLVLFRQADGLVVHRCLARLRGPDGEATVLRMRGDGRPTFDPPVADGDVRGLVRAIRRRGTWWALDRGAGARGWARAVAWHDHAWGLLFAVVRMAAGSRSGADRPRGPARWVARADRLALRAADRALFRWFHARMPAPGAGPGTPPGADIGPLL